MRRYIHVEFLGQSRDPSLSAAVHWYVAHLAGAKVEIDEIAVTIDVRGSRVAVGATLTLADGAVSHATASASDPHAAIATLFAELRRSKPASRQRRAPQFHALAG
jgi:ribosome-associated translation inhibitor RaiA